MRPYYPKPSDFYDIHSYYTGLPSSLNQGIATIIAGFRTLINQLKSMTMITVSSVHRGCGYVSPTKISGATVPQLNFREFGEGRVVQLTTIRDVRTLRVVNELHKPPYGAHSSRSLLNTI